MGGHQNDVPSDPGTRCQHIFWRESPLEPVGENALTAVTCGLQISPCRLAQHMLRHMLEDEGKVFPRSRCLNRPKLTRVHSRPTHGITTRIGRNQPWGISGSGHRLGVEPGRVSSCNPWLRGNRDQAHCPRLYRSMAKMADTLYLCLQALYACTMVDRRRLGNIPCRTSWRGSDNRYRQEMCGGSRKFACRDLCSSEESAVARI